MVGGAKIIWSDSVTDGRMHDQEVTRVSGATDGARLPEETFCGLQVAHNSQPQTYVVGHWNYPAGTTKTVYVASNTAQVKLQTFDSSGALIRDYGFGVKNFFPTSARRDRTAPPANFPHPAPVANVANLHYSGAHPDGALLVRNVRPGQLAYMDSTSITLPDNLPGYLIGGEYVRPFQGDAGETSSTDQYQLDVTRFSYVYQLVDAVNGMPNHNNNAQYLMGTVAGNRDRQRPPDEGLQKQADGALQQCLPGGQRAPERGSRF